MPALNDFAKLYDVIKAVQAVLRGEQNNVGAFTLATGATSTVVQFKNCAPGKSINITPQTANAAAAVPTTYIPASLIRSGSFTVMHASAASADRVFMFEVTGGG